MSTSRALDDLARAASAAGYAMANIDDDPSIDVTAHGDEVARGSRLPTAAAMLTALPAPASRTTKSEARGFVAGAQQVREAVFGYLRLGATA